MNTSLSNLFSPVRRRKLLLACGFAAASLSSFAFTHGVWHREPEKKNVTIAVGGQHLYYYLPMTLADWMGFYRDEGLNVTLLETQSGSNTRQAVMGGRADVASGAFEHTVVSQSRGLNLTAFVLQGRTPQCVFAMNRGTMGDTTDLKKLLGHRIGVSAPGSASHIFANFVMARAGVAATEFFPVGIGTGKRALEAIHNNEVDAFVGLDPVMAQLAEEKRITVVADTSTPEKSDAFYGGPMVGGCLYAPSFFLERYPETTQRLTNAVLSALEVIHGLTPEELLKIAPKEVTMGMPERYAQGFINNREALSLDGRFPKGCVDTVTRVLASSNAQFADFHPQHDQCYTNRFVDAAEARL